MDANVHKGHWRMAPPTRMLTLLNPKQQGRGRMAARLLN